MSRYIPTIGLEIHAELLTKSKIFCACTAEFGGEPNTRCCPVCSGLPGALPVLNRTAVEYTIKAGYCMNCKISRFTKWDRKNYFYPDLPKAYQISQLPRPLCLDGNVEIEVNGERKNIRINRIHLEEDAGKLVHDGGGKYSLADYNRCGIPLIEIVTEPDFHSADDVSAFIGKIRLMLRYAGVCDCKMEQGSLRCDVNISLAPEGAPLGTRAEIKNLNSVRAIGRAIEYEIRRQTRLLDKGMAVEQETRRFSDATGETSVLRSKEEAHDYRYFPDADIPPVVFTEEELAEIKASLPEMPESRRRRYISEYSISKNEADILVADKAVSDFFEKAVAVYANPRAVSSFILVELMRRINMGEADMSALKITGEMFGRLVELGYTDKISKDKMKDVLRIMLETGSTADSVADEKNLWIKEDSELVKRTVTEIIEANPQAVEQYKSGEQKVFSFLMGQANRRLKGAASAAVIKKVLEEMLSAL